VRRVRWVTAVMTVRHSVQNVAVISLWVAIRPRLRARGTVRGLNMLVAVVAVAGLILAGLGFSLGVLLNQGTPTARGRGVYRALDVLLVALVACLALEFYLVLVSA
jgi:hypothetical protein